MSLLLPSDARARLKLVHRRWIGSFKEFDEALGAIGSRVMGLRDAALCLRIGLRNCVVLRLSFGTGSRFGRASECTLGFGRSSGGLCDGGLLATAVRLRGGFCWSGVGRRRDGLRFRCDEWPEFFLRP